MAIATCGLMWLMQLLKNLKLGDVKEMKLICDNQDVLHIASNLIFCQRTKHVENEYHFVQEKVLSSEITTGFVNSNDLLVDIFTKFFRGSRVESICNKLGTYDIDAPI